MIPDTTGATTRAATVQRVIRGVQDLDYRYLGHRPPRDKIYNPWMPFQPGEFLSFMFEIVAEMRGHKILDVGCGPATKLDLAAELFGLETYGLEVDLDMALVASVRHEVVVGDALGFSGYGNYDLIWLFRPFNDPHFEYELEAQIVNQMKVGAILAGGAWEMERPPQGWITIIDDWDNGRRGAWQKPGIPG